MTVEKSDPTTQESDRPEWLNPNRCLIGSGLAGVLTFACYLLTKAIVVTYATKPITGNSMIALRIASAVRTLMMGMASLGTFIFAIATLGLLALAIQLLIQGNQGQISPKG